MLDEQESTSFDYNDSNACKNICLEQKLPYWNYKWQKKIYKKKYKI